MSRGRQKHTENGGRKPARHQRAVPTHQFRLDVVNYFEAHDMPATLNKFYGGLTGRPLETKRKSIYCWRKQKTKLIALCLRSATAQQRKIRDAGTATTLPADAELHIVKWINNYRSNGLPVSSLMLQRKALAVGRDADVPADLFAASRGWATGFLKRHQLSLRARTRQGQVPPSDLEAALRRFNADVKQRMNELGVDVAYNADQTPVFFEYLPKSTINEKGARTVWVRSAGKDKERLTCMLLGDSLGRKYPPYLVLKVAPSKVPSVHAQNAQKRHGFGKRLWIDVKALQARHSVIMFGNKSGWWNEGLTIDFLRYNFADRHDPQTPVLLLLDEFSGHWTDAVMACAAKLNVELMRVPAGCTGACQPADVAWNHPLKLRLREQWIAHLEDQMRTHDAAIEASAAFRMVPPSRSDVVSWIAEAWGALTADTIANGFNGVLQESMDDEETRSAVERIITRLSELDLLDTTIGEVSIEQDIVDSVIDSIDIEPAYV